MRPLWLRLAPALALFSGAAACSSVPPAPAGRPAARFVVDSVATGTAARLIGLDAAGPVVWAAGAGGAWARSLDGGRTWTAGAVPGADTLQFRDVHAVDARRAVLLSIGPGTASRLYTTDDGGASWALRWTNPDPRAFYDCMAFDGAHGLAVSDAVPRAGDSAAWHLPMVQTTDTGRTWRLVHEKHTLRARPHAGAFASSGTCMIRHDGTFLLATNRPDTAVGTARVSRWYNGRGVGMSQLPVWSTDPMRGVSTLAVSGGRLYAGLLGEIDGHALFRIDLRPAPRNVRLVQTGPRSYRMVGPPPSAVWQPLPRLPIARVYGLAASPHALVATGPDGLAASSDGGQTWRLLVRADLWSAARVDDRTFVAVGRGGRAVRVTVPR